jgi:hypothetical protein
MQALTNPFECTEGCRRYEVGRAEREIGEAQADPGGD